MYYFLFVLALAAVDGHNGKIQNEGALQSGLTPQELNTEFVSDWGGPWKELLPLRVRRDVGEPGTSLDRVRTYSRVVACVVLALSAVVEIIVYLLDMYNSY